MYSHGKNFWPGIAVLLFVFTSNLSACASIFNKAGNTISFESDPEGAEVSIEYISRCKTPCQTKLDVRYDHIAKLSLEGYDDSYVFIKRSMDARFFLNFLLYPVGLLGAAYDWYTAKMWKFKDREFSVALTETAPEEEIEITEFQEESNSQDVSRFENSEDYLYITQFFEPDYLIEQITLYYGSLSEEQLQAKMDRIYEILISMYRNGEQINLDEAMRREHFNL